MKISRRGLFGMLTAAPLLGLWAFRVLPWKISFKAALMNKAWVEKLEPEQVFKSTERLPDEYKKILAEAWAMETKWNLQEIAREISEMEKSFMKPHTVKL